MPHPEPARAAPPRVRLVELGVPALCALAAGDDAAASRLLGVAITPYIGAGSRWLWQLRLRQVSADPAEAAWIARIAIDEGSGAAVGHAGFHGRPDARGMVEAAYAVDPAERRRGVGRALLVALLARARAAPDVQVVRASIAPANTASLRTLAGLGFAQVGEQWDDEDGLELVFEVAAGVAPGAGP